MNYNELVQQIYDKKSFLCVGLDTDFSLLPDHLKELDVEKALWKFNTSVIDITAPLAVAFKLNIAFYESLGFTGWHILEETVAYIKERYPQMFIIADAKRGDIGNTSAMYAKTFFTRLRADAVTVAPYMGQDSVTPFLQYQNKWTIILGLTSNKGSFDFQHLQLAEGGTLHEKVIETAAQWGNNQNTMFVVGATQAEQLAPIREIVPEHFLLVPGIGAQGGNLEDVAKYGMIPGKCGLLVNASRSIIYAGQSKSYCCDVLMAASDLQEKMAKLLEQYGH